MSGGWKGSRRRQRLPQDWPQRVAYVWDRDKVCVLCGAPGADVDHIQRGDDHSYSNLRLLCGPCHKGKTTKEGHAAYRAARSSVRRPPERHPGFK